MKLVYVVIAALAFCEPASATHVNIRYANKTGACVTVAPSALFLRPCTKDPDAAATQLFDFDTLEGKLAYGKNWSLCLTAAVWQADGGGSSVFEDCPTKIQNSDDDQWNFDVKWSYDNTAGRISTTNGHGQKWCLDSNQTPIESERITIGANNCGDIGCEKQVFFLTPTSTTTV
jgi:hypothetical protein